MMAKQDSSSPWLSIGEAARFLGISRDTLRRWEKKGKIKPVRSPTNRRYYTKAILNQVMAGKKLAKVSKNKENASRKLSLTQKIILIGIGSFLIAVGLMFFVLQSW